MINTRRRSPLKFLLLVFALSMPFWLIGGLSGIQMLPGLPVSALMFVCPVTAASILVYAENGRLGVIGLLKRSFDFRRIRAWGWYVPIICLMPAATVLTYAVMWATGASLPSPPFPALAAVAMFLGFCVAALGEELGWTGYAIDPMQERWNALEASVRLGRLLRDLKLHGSLCLLLNNDGAFRNNAAVTHIADAQAH